MVLRKNQDFLTVTFANKALLGRTTLNFDEDL
jgi:hypothetical protein